MPRRMAVTGSATASLTVLALAASGLLAPPAIAARPALDKVPVAEGYGGAVSTVDPDATAAGLRVLADGGNAVDAAVAAAATLGVTEPYSAGIGGGGYLVHYDAASGEVSAIDGRETAPAAMGPEAFVEDGVAIPFAEGVTSGLSVGVPGTPATWADALDRWGTLSLRQALRPAIRVAQRGFVVDETFRSQTAGNEERFRDIVPTRELFLPGGELPVVGSTFRNRDLARTYRLLSREGVEGFYTGDLAEDIVTTVRTPPVDPAAPRPVRPGLVTAQDLAAYATLDREPTQVDYRGYAVYGMPPSSSGGSTVGEALNILETFDLPSMPVEEALHYYVEASALAFADRNRYVGDVADVPLAELLSDGYAAERACLIDPDAALPKPVAPGTPDGDDASGCADAGEAGTDSNEGLSTTHLTTADRWGDVVSYTLTIESTGGSAITVPGRGFLLNNELTDFNFTPTQGDAPDPNIPGPGKRPRSSMAPTIVLDGDGEPFIALGSPGGATIITTVLQTIMNRVDLGMTLPEAVAAPRASQRNAASTQVEPTIAASGLLARGHVLAGTTEIGAATAIEFLPDGRLQAVAEPVRRGGGAAGVVSSTP